MKLYIRVLATALFTFPPSVLLADDPLSMSDAVSLMKQRKWPEAVAALEEITKDQPNNATAVFNLAVALKSGGERERATGVFLRAVFAYEELTKANPNSGAAWYNLAYSLMATGESDRALETYQKAMIFREVRASAYFDTARLHAIAGRKDQAFAAIDEARSAGLTNIESVANEADFKNLKNDERFSRLLGHDYHKLTTKDGTVLEYALVKPEKFDASKAYPALLAITGGAQDREAVDWGLSNFWGSQAASRGWLVVSPIAPKGVRFFDGSQRFVPELLDAIEKEFKIDGGKFHLAGRSSGGISAFPIAMDSPERFSSVTTFPGHPVKEEDLNRLDRLKDVRVTILVGEYEDRVWGEGAKFVAEKLQELGGNARWAMTAGEGHAMPSMRDGGLIDFLDEMRAGMPQMSASDPE